MPTGIDIAQSLATYLTELAACNRPLTPDDDLFSTGVLESLAMMDLLYHVEQKYGVTLEPADIKPRHFQSTRSLGDLVAGKLRTQSTAA